MAKPAKTTEKHQTGNPQATRETVESVVIAFVLAFLFRAFVAEAFVIPTGSMAPTLMGAHKDLVCEFCGDQYQASASEEFNSNTGKRTDTITIASVCATCRGLNKYDFRNNANHVSFSGDRILVSKFDYVLASPQRWDVFVFKFPENARVNYIKRLVGLPGEELLIEGGDIYTRGDDEWSIARKPPHKIRTMRQIVSDTAFRADILIEHGWPSLWQPWSPNGGAETWQIENTPEVWSAQLTPDPELTWLRYYHKVPSKELWGQLTAGEAPDPIDPMSSELVTDFVAYNSSVKVGASRVYEKPRTLRKEIQGDRRAYDALITRKAGEIPDWRNDPFARQVVSQGYHWVGDLIGDFQVEVSTDSGVLALDLVEYGIHYRCFIDVANGQATLSATAGQDSLEIFDGASTLTGQSPLRGAGSYHIEFANTDDQLVLWINGDVVEFDRPAVFDSRQVRNGNERRPHWDASDPLDAAPIGIGGQNIGLRIERARVHRDIYYIAAVSADSNAKFCEYDLSGDDHLLRAAVVDPSVRAKVNREEAILAVYAHPQWWQETKLFTLRNQMRFNLKDDQYFPMGDNSAASSDARVWPQQNFVEQRFLLGKALLVFWPHTWNTPVPYTPNFSRMGLIR